MRFTLLTLSTILLLLSRADAQSPAATAAEAEFTKGRQLIGDGKVAEACTAFEHSQKLDPQLGTLFNLAGCYERLGKKASAWTAYREIAQRDTNATRKAQAADAATRLGPQLAHLMLKPSTTPGVTVTLDGADITSAIGIEMPIDRGQFQLVVKAPGFQPWTGALAVAEDGKLVTQQLPELAKDPLHVTADPAKPNEPVAACFPSCRDGYTCRAGQCEATTATKPVDAIRAVEPIAEPPRPPRYQFGVVFGYPSMFAGDKATEIMPTPTVDTTVWGRQTLHLGGQMSIRERGPLWLAVTAAFGMNNHIHYLGGGASTSGDGSGAFFAVEQVLRIPITEPGWELLLDHKIALDLAAGGFFMLSAADAGLSASARISMFWLDLGPTISFGSQSGFNAGFTSGARVAF